jgi:hypothetical protein
MAVVPVPAAFSFTAITKFTLQRATNAIRSRYTGADQIVSYPFAVWYLEGNLVEYDGANAGYIRSFFAQLEGQKNTFRLPVPGYVTPSTGYAFNSATIASSMAARASSVVLAGLTPSAPILAEGDYFMMNDELKVCTASVSSNSGGNATVAFKPPARKAGAIGLNVYFQNPTIYMRAQHDDVATWAITPPNRHPVKFQAVEAITLP